MLETSRCIVRNFEYGDTEELYTTLSDKAVMEYIEPPFTLEQTREFIEEAGLCSPPLVYALVWKETNRVIGHIIYHLYEEDSYEIGWIINKDYWNLGIATEITKELIHQTRLTEAASCVIECDPDQQSSKRIALKNGFIYEGEDDGCEVYRLKL